MPAEFGIIYQAIFHSSLMDLPIPVRYVWDCILILSGPTPYVRKGREAIAHETRLPLKLVSSAIDIFLAPDNDSTTKTHEGRRLALIEPGNERAGFKILNKEIWRERSIEDRKLARRSKDTHRKRVKRAEAQSTKVNIITDNITVMPSQKSRPKGA
jgi:hypothetical protein